MENMWRTCGEHEGIHQTQLDRHRATPTVGRMQELAAIGAECTVGHYVNLHKSRFRRSEAWVHHHTEQVRALYFY